MSGGDEVSYEVTPGQRAGQYSRPRLQTLAAASDAAARRSRDGPGCARARRQTSCRNSPAQAGRRDLAAESFDDVAALIATVAREARDGDTILVKGSRAMKLDEFVLGVTEALARRA